MSSGRRRRTIALPLRRENSALIGFFVLGGTRRPPAHVELATARSVLDRLGLALAEAADADALPPHAVEPRARRETVVFREGFDLSVLVVGTLLDVALQAVEQVRQDVSVELLLLHAEGTWDADTVMESVAKTSKVVLVHQNSGETSCGSPRSWPALPRTPFTTSTLRSGDFRYGKRSRRAASRRRRALSSGAAYMVALTAWPSRPSRHEERRGARGSRGSCSRSSSEASTSGSLRPPTSWPRRFSAALIAMGLPRP